MTLIDYVIIAFVGALVVGALFVIYNNKKKGKNSCGCDCANCSKCKFNDKN